MKHADNLEANLFFLLMRHEFNLGDIKHTFPLPILGEGYDRTDAGGRAMHGAIAEGEG